LKEQISNLSSLLPGIIAGRLPSKWLVIETIPHHELSDYPFEELFQFSNDRESKLGNLRSEEPSQPPQVHVNEQLLYTQGTIESVQSIRPDCTSESLQSRSLNIEIEDGNLSNSATDYSEYTHSSACHERSDYHQKLDQEFSDYYCEDVDWRAQQPSACEGDFLDSQNNNLQRSGPSEAEFSDWDSLIDYSPRITPSIASTNCSTLATEPDIKSPALVDAWQDEGMTNCIMAWTAHGEGAGTINPKDLLQASV
jgi:hypothetical protein